MRRQAPESVAALRGDERRRCRVLVEAWPLLEPVVSAVVGQATPSQNSNGIEHGGQRCDVGAGGEGDGGRRIRGRRVDVFLQHLFSFFRWLGIV
jgi:hypothetical protein